MSRGTVKTTYPGNSFPLGATYLGAGVNFAVFAEFADSMQLVLFDHEDDVQPSRIIEFDKTANKTFFYWHVFVPGLKPGQRYGFRAGGPWEPESGHRFDKAKLLLDPYGKAVAFPKAYDPETAKVPGDNCATAAKSVVVDRRGYNWEGDQAPNYAYTETVIYELHVGGFTKHPNSGVTESKRGTYAGLVEKIPYLKELGINCVELMPIQQFEESSFQPHLSNYWGYNPIAFFAPHLGYSSDKDPLGAVKEFKDMVKALHKAGISVILDVVFNHTAEGNQMGPTQSFRGLSNRVYYILEPLKAYYSNFSGCGNTLNANRSVVRRMILDCLKYWVAEMHVDGFRFDLASTFSRDEYGRPLENPPILWDIETDPILANAKIIAEPWDAAGLYQVGTFIGHRWAEWNGRFRDDVRQFIKSDRGLIQDIAARITGSADLFSKPGALPNRSINFVTCHDGFTLADLVSYNGKHNLENGEGNRDGANANFSWNCGVEGSTDDQEIIQLRERQMKNLMTLLMVSEGTPMLTMGDEVRRTQKGNNNAYCQDNEISWFDWKLTETHADMHRFVKMLIELYGSLKIFQLDDFWMAPATASHPHLTWHGVKLYQPDWGPDSHMLAFTLDYPESGDHLHIMLNAYWREGVFQIPESHGEQQWHRIVDTSLASPDDIRYTKYAPLVTSTHYKVNPRTIAILKAE